LAASVVDSFEDFQLTVENFVSMEQTGAFTVSLGYLAGQGRRMNVWAMNCNVSICFGVFEVVDASTHESTTSCSSVA
jgi:hypothetical protein